LLESKFQKHVKTYLENCGAMVLNVHGHQMQAAGWPDLYVAHENFNGWVELKVGKNWLSKLQEHRCRELDRRGVPALCLRMEEPKRWVVYVIGFDGDWQGYQWGSELSLVEFLAAVMEK